MAMPKRPYELAFALWLSFHCLRLASAAGCLPGTTPNIKGQFIKRCNEYLVANKGNGLYNPEADKNPKQFCTDTWGVFSSAFAGKDICTVKPEAYKPFFEKTGQTPIRDKLLFWSGTFKLSSAFSEHGKRFVTLADTLTGALVTDFSWCGDPMYKSPDGLNYQECRKCKEHDYDPIPPEGFEVFWGLASEEFAKRAEGHVQHLITSSGTTLDSPDYFPRKAFQKYTFFFRHELPSLNKNQNGTPNNKVSSLTVLLVNQPGLPIVDGEHCGSGTLIDLKQAIDAKKIPTACIENPPDILKLLPAPVASTPARLQRKSSLQERLRL